MKGSERDGGNGERERCQRNITVRCGVMWPALSSGPRVFWSHSRKVWLGKYNGDRLTVNKMKALINLGSKIIIVQYLN